MSRQNLLLAAAALAATTPQDSAEHVLTNRDDGLSHEPASLTDARAERDARNAAKREAKLASPEYKARGALLLPRAVEKRARKAARRAATSGDQ